MTIPSRPAPAPPVTRGQNAAAGANASIEQLRLQLQQQQIHQQQNRGVQKMTISLPPPPKGSTATPMANRNNSISSNNNYNSFNMDSNQSAITRKFPQARYTPTTNWEDDPFGANAAAAANANGNGKKVPPPRPPPPKVQVNGRKAPQPPSTHSTKLLSNIFRSKKSSNSSISNNNNKANKIYGVSSGVYAINNTSVTTTNSNSSGTTTYNTSSATNGSSSSHSWQANWNSSYSSTSLTSLSGVNAGGAAAPSTIDAQLISFDSPPSSPTFTQKSNSDCLSVDSFSSDSNFSSPNNGSASQPESGFEDDFNARSRPATTSPLDPWEAFDSGFNTAVDSIYGSTAATNNIGTAPVRNLNTINSRIQSSNDNPLCNGKNLLPPAPALNAPTIIKPKVSQKPRAPKPPVLQKSQLSHSGNDTPPTPPSPPMPVCAPPPPPNGVSLLDVISGKADALQLGAVNGHLGFGVGTEETRPHGVALYDFDGVEEGDLSFRANEKIYILEQVSPEWYRGRTRSGCEGIFPINYIDIKVPLVEQHAKNKPIRVRCLYSFPAEYDGDLALKENEMVSILYKINEDWLYGEVDGRQGQFPANFIEYLPDNIPVA